MMIIIAECVQHWCLSCHASHNPITSEGYLGYVTKFNLNIRFKAIKFWVK